MHPVCLHLAHR